MSFETILVDVEDGIMTITMNRPERLNAWTHQMGSEMEAALKQGNNDSQVDAFVVTGSGRGFCAGADAVGFTCGCAFLALATAGLALATLD